MGPQPRPHIPARRMAFNASVLERPPSDADTGPVKHPPHLAVFIPTTHTFVPPSTKASATMRKPGDFATTASSGLTVSFSLGSGLQDASAQTTQVVTEPAVTVILSPVQSTIETSSSTTEAYIGGSESTEMQTSITVLTMEPTQTNTPTEPSSSSTTPSESSATESDQPLPSITQASIETATGMAYGVFSTDSTLQTSIIPVSGSFPTNEPAQPTETILGSPKCKTDPRCEKETAAREGHKAEVAGAVVGVIALGLVVLIGWLLYQRYRRLKQEHAVAGQASWSGRQTSESDSSSWFKHNRGKSATTRTSSSTVLEPKSGSHDLGEPGPAISRTLSDREGWQENRNRSTASTLSLALEDFHRPSYGHLGQSIDYTKSKIGVALSRYSSADSAVSPLVSTRDASPVKPIPSHAMELATLADKLTRLSKVSKESIRPLQHRSSTTSANSEAHTIFIGRAKTARRHSLTPRIINIVANSTSSDDMVNSATQGGGRSSNRSSARARSVSPMKQHYSGSPAKLKSHFGVDVWNRDAGRISENQGVARAGSARDSATQHERAGSSLSYPALGRTMSEVKRTIRAQKERAFSGSITTHPMKGDEVNIETPHSVNVERRGKNTKVVRL